MEKLIIINFNNFFLISIFYFILFQRNFRHVYKEKLAQKDQQILGLGEQIKKLKDTNLQLQQENEKLKLDLTNARKIQKQKKIKKNQIQQTLKIQMKQKLLL